MQPVLRYGVSRVYQPVDAADSKSVVNIVFVHGLRGHPRTTWEYSLKRGSSPAPQLSHQVENAEVAVSKSFSIRSMLKRKPKSSQNPSDTEAIVPIQSTEKPSRLVFWPEELLPKDLPNVNVWMYGYDADLAGSFLHSAAKSSISQFGNDLMVNAVSELPDQAPIIFVAHSLGGIVVKDALRRSKTSLIPRMQVLYQRTRAVFFLGTPHRGSPYGGWGITISNLLKILFLDVNERVLEGLKVDSEILDNINDEFNKLIYDNSFQIHSFVEGRAFTGVRGLNTKIVPDFSSKIGHPMEVVETIESANHMEMARYENASTEGYKKVQRALHHLVQEITSASPASIPIHPNAQQFLRAISRENVEAQLDFVPRNHPGTGLWILQSDQFQRWRTSENSNDSLMWLSGNIGWGKTVALRYLIETLQETYTKARVVYYFFGSSTGLGNDYDSFVRSVTSQILINNPIACNELGCNYDPVQDQAKTEHANILWYYYFCAAASSMFSPGYTYLIIDGVDELAEGGRKELFRDLINSHRGLYRDGNPLPKMQRPKLRTILASRPWQSIADTLDQFSVLSFDTAIQLANISSCFGKEVQSFAERERIPESLSQQIQEQLVQKSEGMFLWADLAWKQFQNIDCEWSRSIVERQLDGLKALPRGLRALYVTLITHLNLSVRALSILEWILCGARPLKLSELEISISIRPDSSSEMNLDLPFDLRRTLHRLFGPLVRINDETETVQVCHASAKDLFIQLAIQPDTFDPAFVKRHSIDIAATHRRLAFACLRYLCFRTIPWGPGDTMYLKYEDHFLNDCHQHAFLAYSIEHWRLHMEHALISNSVQLPQKYGTGQSALMAFTILDNFDINTNHNRGLRLIHIACKWSMTDIFGVLLDRNDVELNVLNDDNSSALHIACYYGARTMALKLIAAGGDGKSLIKDARGYNVLHLAAIQNEEEIAYEIIRGWNRLPPEVNALDADGKLLVPRAIQLGWDKVLNILFRLPGLDVNQTDNLKQSIAHYAAIHGHMEALEYVILHKGSLSSVDIQGRTPLHYAAEQDVGPILDTLIAETTDVNTLDSEGRTPLHFAMMIDKVSSCLSLIGKGANINQPDKKGVTPIHLAAFWGQTELLQALLARSDVDIECYAKNGDGLVHWAARSQQRSLEILVQYPRIDISATGRYDRTVLHYAWHPMMVPAIKAILGLVPPSLIIHCDSFGMTCLHTAAMRAPVEVFNLLVYAITCYSKSAIDFQDQKRKTALHYAVEYGDSDLVRSLLRAGANKQIRDGTGVLPEVLAVQKGADKVLIEFGWSAEAAIELCTLAGTKTAANIATSFDLSIICLTSPSKLTEFKDKDTGNHILRHMFHDIIWNSEDIKLAEEWIVDLRELNGMPPYRGLSPERRLELAFIAIEVGFFLPRRRSLQYEDIYRPLVNLISSSISDSDRISPEYSTSQKSMEETLRRRCAGEEAEVVERLEMMLDMFRNFR